MDPTGLQNDGLCNGIATNLITVAISRCRGGKHEALQLWNPVGVRFRSIRNLGCAVTGDPRLCC